ncbi:MAG TPA: tripartite tricarboxylate transporter permease [Burkholderiales bacterium]|jgi:TctA family transporter|nr:tripartite tricarboxylate transporter permease [Burkholderiales bacterium]
MGELAHIFPNLALGFSTAVSPINLFYCFVGVLVGTLIGVLPGIGSVAAVAMLLPLTFNLDAVGAIIMLAGIYYGTQYGGSTTAILVNLPGESASVVTCMDGHQMAKRGRAGPALAIAAIGSFFAGSVGTVLVALLGPPLAEFALKFGAPEYFSLMVMALIAAAVLAHGSLIKTIGMILLGLLFGIVGTDVNSGMSRFTFGATGLTDGMSFAMVAMGLFGFSEILMNLEQGADTASRDILKKKITNLMPNWQDLKAAWPAIVRGTAVGAFFGTLPGGGPTISAFSSYALEKKVAKDASGFGKGDIRGVAAPESANNAAVQCAFITTLTLGIPHGATMALLLGALTIQGIAPGPQVMTQRPELFWGLIASMWIGNAMLVILNLPLVGVWVKLLTVPYRMLFPAIMAFMAIGVYSVNNLDLDIYMTIFFGLLGYLFQKLKCEPAPLILAFVLGPLMEENLRRALLISRGDATVFIRHPISAAFLIATIVLLAILVIPSIRKKREEAVAEAEVA